MDDKEFCEKMAALPPIVVKEEWDRLRDSMRYLTKSEGPANFLKWYPIQYAINVGRNYLKEDLQLIQNSTSDYKEVLKEIETDENNDVYCNLVHQLCHLVKYDERGGEKISSLGKIVEFGGGFGAMCYLIHLLGFKGSYIIIDLPELLLIQQYFLQDVIYNPKIFFVDTNGDTPSTYGGDLFIALWSLSEVVDERPAPKAFNTKNYLIAYQTSYNTLNNMKYFVDFKQTNNHCRWFSEDIQHLGGNNRYLIGVK